MKKMIKFILGIFLSLLIPLNGYAETYSIKPDKNQFFNTKNVIDIANDIDFLDKNMAILIENNFRVSFDIESISKSNNFKNKGFNTLAEIRINSDTQDYLWLLNLIFPGLAQMLKGEVNRGLVFLVIFGSVIYGLIDVKNAKSFWDVIKLFSILAFYPFIPKEQAKTIRSELLPSPSSVRILFSILYTSILGLVVWSIFDYIELSKSIKNKSK